jgi:chemotaxis protein methyltransferase CheR
MMRSLSFDVVLCRNLLIYVNEPEKPSVLERLTEVTKQGGYLVLGKTETLPEEYDDEFKSVDSRLRVYRFVA